MDRQKKLQWILIKRFIEILILVGITEYLLTVFINRVAVPVVFAYFFPEQAGRIRFGSMEMVIGLVAVLVMLILNVIRAAFPLAVRNMLGKVFGMAWRGAGVSASVAMMDGKKAFLLFLTVLAGMVLMLLPYIIGAVCFARITIREFGEIAREREEEQREFDRRRNLMLSDIAHDLRTPMTTVNGYAKALADGMVEDAQKKQEYLQAIQRKSARMNELIQFLFEYVKLDSEGFSLNLKRTDLYELLRENAALVYPDMEEAGMEFEIEIPEEIFYVQADAIQLSRVVTNLLNNARKHNPAGSRILLMAGMQGRRMCVTVADNGPFIPEELAEHIFEPFARGDASRGSEGGSGLGLSIAKKIVEMHGWNITLCQDRGQVEEGYTKKFQIEMLSDNYDAFFTGKTSTKVIQ